MSKVINLKKYKRSRWLKRVKERIYLSGTPIQIATNVGVLIVLATWFMIFSGVVIFQIVEVLTK